MEKEKIAEKILKQHPDFEAEGLSDYMNGYFNGIIAGLAHTEQKLNLSGIGSKRPDCPYCIEPISKEAIERWDNWLKKTKAACASGGEGTVAEGAGREIKDYRIEQPTEGGVIGTEFGFTEHNGE